MVETVQPPRHLEGIQKANRFATQTDLVNILTWKAPSQGTVAVAYKIFRDSHLNKLLAVISSQQPLKFEDHNRKKGKTNTYFIVSIDSFGNISTPATVTIKGCQ